MKLALTFATALLSTTAFATDYSGCNPTVFPKSKPEYALSDAGKLVMNRKGANVVKAVSGDGADEYVTVYSAKPRQLLHQELKRENGRPLSLKSYITDDAGKRVGGATIRTFAFTGDHCFVREVESQQVGVDGLYGSFVTYDRKFCEELLKSADQMKDTARDRARVKVVLDKFDNAFQADGRRLYGYDAASMKKHPMDTVASIVGTCNAIAASYGPLVGAESRGAGRASAGGNASDDTGAAGAGGGHGAQ